LNAPRNNYPPDEKKKAFLNEKVRIKGCLLLDGIEDNKNLGKKNAF